MKIGFRLGLMLCLGSPLPLMGCVSDDNAAPPPGTGADGGGDDGSAFDATTSDTGSVDAAGGADAGGDTGSVDAAGGADAGGDTSALDGATDASADASDGGLLGTVYYVDPVNGLDTNAGTKTAPFKSIAQAEKVIDLPDAGAGPFTVSLASGTYSAANQSTMVVSFRNAPVSVVAAAPGSAIFLGAGSGAGEGLTFGKGGAVRNVTFKNTSYGAEGLGGRFDVSGCSFDGAGGSGYFLAFIKDTVGTFDTSGGATITNLGMPSLGGVYIDDTANVGWIAGGTTVTSAASGVGSLVFMRNKATLTVDGLNVSSFPGRVIVGYDQANVTLQNTTITKSGVASGGFGPGQDGAIVLGASQNGAPAPSLSLNNTSVTGSKGSAVYVQTQGTTAAVTLRTLSSHLDGNSSGGIWIEGLSGASLAVDIGVNASTFDNNGFFGIATTWQSTPAPGSVALTFAGTGNSVSGNGASASANGYTPGGIVLAGSTLTNALTLRNATLKSNTGNAITFAGTAASRLDLGTQATPGGNTFSGVASTATALDVASVVTNATAVGNTWIPSVQGADAAGHFPAGTTLKGPQTGQNVTLPAGVSLVLTP